MTEDVQDQEEVRLAEKFDGMEGHEIVDYIREKDTIKLESDSHGADKDLPTYLQADEELRQKEVTVTVAELHTMMYQFDWIEILRNAVESRPTSWGVQKGEEYAAVPEWRNAADTLVSPVWKRLFQELYKKGESPSKSAEHGTAGVADRQSHSEDVREPPKPEADAWCFKLKGPMGELTKCSLAHPEDAEPDFDWINWIEGSEEPLFSAGTIQEVLDDFRDRIYEEENNATGMQEVAAIEIIKKLEEVFSGDD